MLGGGVVAGGGAALIVLNASTKVSQTGDPRARIADPQPRATAWRGNGPEQRSSLPEMGLCLLRGSF
jgi:hypothetical protein